MKQGANFQDRNRIAKLAQEGLTAEEISAKVLIAESVVEGFMPVEDEDEDEDTLE